MERSLGLLRRPATSLAHAQPHRLDAARTGGENLGYRAKRDGTTVPLLTKPGTGRWQKFTCLNSLRDVEPMSGFILVDDPTDDIDDLEAEA